MTLPLASLGRGPFFPAAVASAPTSSVSSKVVALVEYEPCADELLLCGGEKALARPSKSLIPARFWTAFPSVVCNDDALEPRWLAAELSLDFFLAVPVADLMRSGEPRGVCEVELAADAVDSLEFALGGWGNEAILTVLRRLFSAPPPANAPEVDRKEDTLEDEFD